MDPVTQSFAPVSDADRTKSEGTTASRVQAARREADLVDMGWLKLWTIAEVRSNVRRHAA